MNGVGLLLFSALITKSSGIKFPAFMNFFKFFGQYRAVRNICQNQIVNRKNCIHFYAFISVKEASI